MAIQYVNSPESDFSKGIDARSAENQIAPGFVQDLLNADVVESRARKRKGYQGFAGNVPVRVTQMEYMDGEDLVCFTLDSAVSLDTAVSLETVTSSPIVVYGRSSSFTTGQGPFTTDGDTAKYYPKFLVPLRKTLTAPSGTLTIEGTEHGLGTTNLFLYVVESTSMTSRSYQKVITDAVRIDETTFDVEIDYTVFEDKDVFVFFADKDPVTGQSYVATLSHTGTGSETFTITAATHALASYNIIPQIQEDLGTDRGRTIPDQFVVEPDGDVVITINSSAATTYYALLSAAPIVNTVTGIIPGAGSGSITISAPDRPWVFFGIYLEQTPGGDRELVYPDLINFDEDANEFSLSFTNMNATARNFIVFYEYGEIRSNQLCVEDSTVTVDGTDDRPQITIWGLDHTEIYLSNSEREGWVNHIDSYRRSGEQRLVCGLGGNLFSERTYLEAASTYLYPRLYPRLFARTNIDRVVAPLFWDTGDTPARTRGYITATDSGTHWAVVTGVSYDSGNQWTKYTISLPSKQILDSTGSPTTLSSVISTTTNLEDFLTVQNMSYARHNGTFRIRQLLDGVNSIQVWVENESNNADYDDANTGGEAGVFTDQLTWTANGPFIPGDLLISEALGDTFVCEVQSALTTTLVTDGIVDLLEIPAGVLFNATRTSDVLPLREPVPTRAASTTNLVRGDMLSYSGEDVLNNETSMARLLRVLYINPDMDRSIDIDGDGSTATATLLSGDTSYLSVGRKLLLLNAGIYSGVQTVSDIISLTEFEFSSEETDSVTGATLAGETAQLDESFEWEDSPGDTNFLTVEKRWIPLEAPDDSFNLTPSTYIRYFDVDSYAAQTFLRSTMVVNNMYLTNSEDEVYKFDGTSIYRAGLLPWQPGLFLTQETTGATIVTNLRSLAYSAKTPAEGKLTITSANQNVVPVGSSVRLSGSTQTYTIIAYTNDGTNYYVLLDRSLDSSVSASGSVAEIGTYRYYFRLNAVDANDNIIASAATGSQDHVVELTGNAAVQIRLVGLPIWDVYDYDRLEVQIYRTQLNQAAPFYLVTTLAMDFDNTQGYITYRDSFADTDLTQLDVVNTALKGAEIGTTWSDPLRAKYVTSIGNKLVLGNIRDYPQLDVQIVGDATVSNATFAGDNLLFRRDNTDSGTSTDMVNRVRYEWVNGFTGTVSNFTPGVNSFSFDTSIATSAATGDWIYLTYATVSITGRQLEYSGWWQISAVSGVTVTVNLVGAAAAAAYPDSYAIATDPTDVPVLLGVDGSMGMVNGDSFDTFDAMRRMSMAINTTMRMVDVSLSGMEEFSPWLQSRGGNDLTPAGRLLLRQPRSDGSTIEIVPTFSGYNLFVNSIKRITGAQISATVRTFPSRILISYENYPEIFDNPTSILDVDSDSAIDINSADGQDVTGIIPFFGEAAFGAAQQSAILVVFKTNSIYLVDLNEKTAGRNPVQRIETEGLGCTAPYSIAVTKNGIMFANESGIYCLRRNQAIQYIGRYMERNWTERVDLDALSIAQGHHYGVGRAYKLSVPLDETVDPSTGYVENSEVYLYNHTAEAEGGLGAWSRYDNHPSTGWANLASNAFFGTTLGRVFSIRNEGQVSDYRDDATGIEFLLDPRPNDFGNSGIRKVVDKIVVHYRTGARNIGTEVLYALDTEEEFQSTTPLIIPAGTTGTGMDDSVSQAVPTVSHSVGRRRCIYFGVRITNGTLDENLEIAGLTYRVGGLQEKGILQAAQTENK